MRWALIGLLAGMLAGCVALSEPDRRVLQDHRISGSLYQKMVRKEPLDFAEIAQLSANKVPPAYLVRYIDDSLAEYELTTRDVLMLKNLGVSHEVIDFMLSTGPRGPNAVLVSDPSPYYGPYFIHRHHRH